MRSLHTHTAHADAGAVFQVASQFNCLEMVGPGSRPEDGVTNYHTDKTQGPVCAMACPAGTVYRNYFWRDTKKAGAAGTAGTAGVAGQAGGSSKQINTAADVAKVLGNGTHKYWAMSNGYLLPTGPGKMKAVKQRLETEAGLSRAVSDAVRVGVHWSTVTATTKRHTAADSTSRPHHVCQVYASAVPVSYTKRTLSQHWEPFATAMLCGAYEATLSVAALLARRDKRRVPVFLTLVGGGAFGNRTMWIYRCE